MTKILLVEDDKSLREIYGVRLLAEGYDIVSAGDGEEALAMAIKERPELIVSDVMMPKISGFDMLDILRSTTETKDIKVIMMTALSSEDQRLRGEQLGADRYLVKSQVGIEDVVRTVHDVLGDIPSAAPSAQQTFGTPAPSAVARPAVTPAPRPAAPIAAPAPVSAAASVAPVAPQQAPAPAPITQAPVSAAPAAPVMQTPTVAPAPSPVVAAPDPVAPAPIQQPQPFTTEQPSSQLPQPTAPFSTPRPASLGERVIHPIDTSSTTVDVSQLIDQELQQGSVAPAPTTPPAPATPQNPFPPTPLQ